MGDTILLRRGTSANLPDLQEGEPGFETDTHKLYVGTDIGTAAGAIQITGHEIDALAYLPNTSTQATITAALTAIGTTNKRTLLLRPGTWVISSNFDASSYTNVTFKIVPGALISHGAFTVNIPNLNAGLYQVFSGTGTVTLSGNITEAYPEWWGVDGTADDVQINAALNATNKVCLQGKRYYVAAPIYPVSNNTLSGSGRDVTYLDYSGGAVDDELSKIEILNKTNVTIKDLSVDGQSADATVGTGSGILVDNGSSNVLISNVHIYDAYKHGLIVNTGSDIHITKLKVSNGCASSAVLIGQFPASYGLAVNKDLYDVTMDDIYLYNIHSDGLGIWNCSGGDGYTSICARINTSNLVVKKWGRSGLGYAYWSSGITTYPTDANLTNFNFDNVGAGNSNIGRGLHIEYGVRLNHSNGNINNLITGAADDKLGYAITCGGGSELTYSNINIYYCGIGVLANNSSNVIFTNIHVNYSKYVAYYIGGSSLKFTNCTDFTTGIYTAVQSSWLIYAAAPLTISQVTLDNCTGYVAAPVSAAYAISVTATALQDLTITNFKSDSTLALSPGSYANDIHSLSTIIKATTSVAAGTDYEIPILVASSKTKILSVKLSFSAAIAVDPTDYNTYKLYQRDSDGASAAAITTAGLVTKTNDFSTALKPIAFNLDSIDDSHIPTASIMTLAKTHSGAGKAEVDGTLTIEYMTY